MKPYIVTLTGPTCSGKSTLENHLVSKGFAKVISTTTRPIREGEQDGLNYYFVSKSEFKRMKSQGDFIESIEYNGEYYAVSAREINWVSEMNKPIVIVVEPSGREQIEEYCNQAGWDLFKVFVSTNREEIAKRFIKRMRGDISSVDIQTKEGAKIFAAICDNYATRLGAMMTREEYWETVANSTVISPYHKLFNYLDTLNEDDSYAVKYLVTGAQRHGYLQ